MAIFIFSNLQEKAPEGNEEFKNLEILWGKK